MPKMQITWLSVYGKGLGTERQQGSNPKAFEEEKYVRFCPPPSPLPPSVCPKEAAQTATDPVFTWDGDCLKELEHG